MSTANSKILLLESLNFECLGMFEKSDQNKILFENRGRNWPRETEEEKKVRGEAESHHEEEKAP